MSINNLPAKDLIEWANDSVKDKSEILVARRLISILKQIGEPNVQPVSNTVLKMLETQLRLTRSSFEIVENGLKLINLAQVMDDQGEIDKAIANLRIDFTQLRESKISLRMLNRIADAIEDNVTSIAEGFATVE